MTWRQAAPDQPLTPATIRLLLVALAMSLAPHVTHLPAVITVMCLAFGLWRLRVITHGWPLPGKIARLVLTLVVLAAVFFTYGTIVGPDPGTALLAAMLGLKLLETRRPRDAALVIVLGYFLAVSNVLYSQSIPLAMYLLLVLLLLTAALVRLNQGASAPAGESILRLSGRLFLQALPIMIVMFLLFPRLPGPLWGSPQDGSGTTGLNDEMTPGSISNLGQSDAIAFRVRFDGTIPDNSLLYWRGPILWHTDGKRWTAGTAQPRVPAGSGPDRKLTPIGPAVRYQVTLEPHRHNWLYALDMPTTLPPGSLRTIDYQVITPQPVNSLMRYEMASHTHYRLRGLDEGERRRALQLPPQVNPRTQALGRQWRREVDDDAALVQRALDFFHEEPFFYTLQPPLLAGDDPMDQFLFSTRRGFCEHYAASFTLLMRAAGIPTRIVTGYQGGELNPVDGYLVVRQRDAHAWTEVWLEERGWVRIDPTAAVAPQRIEKGMDGVLEDSRGGVFGSALGNSLWRQLRNGLDALDNTWSQWVLGYQATLQNQVLSSLGLSSWQARALAIFAGLGVLLSITAWLLLRQRGVRQDPVTAAYRRFCDKLARRGLARRPAEGPVDYADRVIRARPDLYREVEEINRAYIALQYGDHGTPAATRRFSRMVRGFRP